jgi:hypothetical protein
VSIDTERQPAMALLVRGVAAIDVVDGVPDEYIAASTEAMTAIELRALEAHVRSICTRMARISVRPRWARYYDFGSGRVMAFLTKLGSES